ncbi:DUF2189 domain-containing protein [Pseudorhodoplanes sp.]|uniref:DUF2189 domain-containing protein n=1 Tax=Pseudorhodoplanes sp. TaxID=1934341 RepID=UPI002B77B115|nr:DUF2189 domain-containing protein [Pseudorhodoplanes sp.]HWV53346.1 DUF2189 domain-containing protein [Pseudorhodoplanes sp.]
MAQFHVLNPADDRTEGPVIRRIGFADLGEALRQGWEDFKVWPSHAVFLCIIYPIVGLVLGGMALGYSVLPLLFPLAAGFALLGPIAALMMYEISRRLELGEPPSLRSALSVIHSPGFPAIVAIGLMLMGLFLLWLGIARELYQTLFGIYAAPDAVGPFVREVFTTDAGWKLMVYGNAIGFVFALVAFCLTVISFPMLLDRDVGAATAVITSIRAIAVNPVVMAAWGLIVAALLVLGSLPVFLGLAVVMPVLGHATWHLYRKLVV